MFPRASAHAERLWANPETNFEVAQKRFVDFNQRLLRRGINSDEIQPEYCRLNEGKCYFKPKEETNSASALKLYSLLMYFAYLLT